MSRQYEFKTMAMRLYSIYHFYIYHAFLSRSRFIMICPFESFITIYCHSFAQYSPKILKHDLLQRASQFIYQLLWSNKSQSRDN